MKWGVKYYNKATGQKFGWSHSYPFNSHHQVWFEDLNKAYAFADYQNKAFPTLYLFKVEEWIPHNDD